jgi:uncharacterized protein (DUF1684 family)
MLMKEATAPIKGVSLWQKENLGYQTPVIGLPATSSSAKAAENGSSNARQKSARLAAGVAARFVARKASVRIAEGEA